MRTTIAKAWLLVCMAAGARASKREHVVRGRYIVRLCEERRRAGVERHVMTRHADATSRFRGRVTRHLANLLPLMVLEEASEEAVAELRSTPGVCDVEHSTRTRASQSTLWHLDRVNQAALPLDGDSAGDDQWRGRGVAIFVLDTGLDAEHQEFAGGSSRTVANVYSIPDDVTGDEGFQFMPEWGWTQPPAKTSLVANNDYDGHGTHVAATAAGNSVGVAPGANVYGVKVLDAGGSGTTDGILAAMDAIYGVVDQVGMPAILSMSLGGRCVSHTEARGCREDSAYALAIEKLKNEKGVVTVVASGNEGEDACFVLPAASHAAVTVGATDSDDRVAVFSNAGSCVDVVAPGVNIWSARSALMDEDCVCTWYVFGVCFNFACTAPEYHPLQGTSMAAPAVSGALAQFVESTGATRAVEALDAMMHAATPDAVSKTTNAVAAQSSCPGNARMVHTPISQDFVDTAAAKGAFNRSVALCPLPEDQVVTYVWEIADDLLLPPPAYEEHLPDEDSAYWKCDASSASLDWIGIVQGTRMPAQCWAACQTYFPNITAATFTPILYDDDECLCYHRCECAVDHEATYSSLKGTLVLPQGAALPALCYDTVGTTDAVCTSETERPVLSSDVATPDECWRACTTTFRDTVVAEFVRDTSSCTCRGDCGCLDAAEDAKNATMMARRDFSVPPVCVASTTLAEGACSFEEDDPAVVRLAVPGIWGDATQEQCWNACQKELGGQAQGSTVLDDWTWDCACTSDCSCVVRGADGLVRRDNASTTTFCDGAGGLVTRSDGFCKPGTEVAFVDGTDAASCWAACVAEGFTQLKAVVFDAEAWWDECACYTSCDCLEPRADFLGVDGTVLAYPDTSGIDFCPGAAPLLSVSTLEEGRCATTQLAGSYWDDADCFEACAAENGARHRGSVRSGFSDCGCIVDDCGCRTVDHEAETMLVFEPDLAASAYCAGEVPVRDFSTLDVGRCVSGQEYTLGGFIVDERACWQDCKTAHNDTVASVYYGYSDCVCVASCDCVDVATPITRGTMTVDRSVALPSACLLATNETDGTLDVYDVAEAGWACAGFDAVDFEYEFDGYFDCWLDCEATLGKALVAAHHADNKCYCLQECSCLEPAASTEGYTVVRATTALPALCSSSGGGAKNETSIYEYGAEVGACRIGPDAHHRTWASTALECFRDCLSDADAVAAVFRDDECWCASTCDCLVPGDATMVTALAPDELPTACDATHALRTYAVPDAGRCPAETAPSEAASAHDCYYDCSNTSTTLDAAVFKASTRECSCVNNCGCLEPGDADEVVVAPSLSNVPACLAGLSFRNDSMADVGKCVSRVAAHTRIEESPAKCLDGCLARVPDLAAANFFASDGLCECHTECWCAEDAGGEGLVLRPASAPPAAACAFDRYDIFGTGWCKSDLNQRLYDTGSAENCWASCLSQYGANLVALDYFPEDDGCFCQDACPCTVSTLGEPGFLLIRAGSTVPSAC